MSDGAAEAVSRLIAIDYDNTYTADPVLWGAFIGCAKQRGWTVWLVTARNERVDPVPDFGGLFDRVVHCNREGKLRVLERLGVRPHIFVDDHPEQIVADAVDRHLWEGR